MLLRLVRPLAVLVLVAFTSCGGDPFRNPWTGTTVSRIVLLPTETTLAPGDTMQFRIEVTLSDGTVTYWAHDALEWRSSNIVVAGVNGFGMVQAGEMGDATITGWSKHDSDRRATALVHVR
jgi:uncharacterized protein YjdB